MSITIFEGTDFAGKTTKAMSKMSETEPSIYIHFPIRKQSDVVGGDFSDFRVCGSFIDKDGKLLPLDVIQEVILVNITSNIVAILSYYNKGYHVYIDRFILSNIVYRQLHGVPITYGCYGFFVTLAAQLLLSIAKHDIMVPPNEVLAARHLASRRDESEFDKLNEQIENIYRTNEAYREYARSGVLRVAHKNIGYDIDIKLNMI